MLNLSVKLRKETGKKVKKLRKKDVIPAVLYGPKIKKALSLELDYSLFEKVYKEAGESSLISLGIENDSKKNLVLIHDIQRDPLTNKISHVDFYQAPLEEKIVVKIPIVLEGVASAVKDLGGTLVKHISEVEVKSFPQNLPKEIKISVESLKTFENNIKISDLKLAKDVEIMRDMQEIVASVLPPEKVEEELEKPIEEKVEEVEKVEKEKKAEEEVPEEQPKPKEQPKAKND